MVIRIARWVIRFSLLGGEKMRSYFVTFHFRENRRFELLHCLTREAESLLEAAVYALGDSFSWSGDECAQRVTVERFDENRQQRERGSWLIVPGDQPVFQER